MDEWLAEAVAHINKHSAGDRILSVSANPAYACVSTSVLRGDEDWPGRCIQYCPPVKDLCLAAEMIRGQLLTP